MENNNTPLKDNEQQIEQTQDAAFERYKRPGQRRTVTAQQRRKNTIFIVQIALLIAIEAVFCFTPLGSLPAIGPIVMTLAMIPVIISAILFGVGVGSLMGFIAGIFSLIVWTFMPPNPATAFVFSPFVSFGSLQGNFWSVVICLVPRVLTGTVAGLVNRGMTAAFARSTKTAGMKPSAVRWRGMTGYAVSAAAGSLTNTLLVLGGIYLFFGQAYATAIETAYSVILLVIGGMILTNGIPEAILAALCSAAVCPPLKKMMGTKRKAVEA